DARGVGVEDQALERPRKALDRAPAPPAVGALLEVWGSGVEDVRMERIDLQLRQRPGGEEGGPGDSAVGALEALLAHQVDVPRVGRVEPYAVEGPAFLDPEQGVGEGGPAGAAVRAPEGRGAVVADAGHPGRAGGEEVAGVPGVDRQVLDQQPRGQAAR